MAKKLTRRKFIFGAFISGVSLYIGGWWVFKVRKKDATGIILAILKKQLGYMNIDESDLRKFAADFQESISAKSRYMASWAGILRPVYSIVDIFDIMPYSRRFTSFEETTVTVFLLSTDFFDHGADLTRKTRYVGLFDPYDNGCNNPFVNL